MKVDFNEIRMRRGIFLLPNLLTTCCLFGGFYAIVASIDGNFERATTRNLRGHDLRRPRRPRRAPDGHRNDLRQGIRQPRRHGRIRARAGRRLLPVGRRTHCRVRLGLGALRLDRGLLLRRRGGDFASRASIRAQPVRTSATSRDFPSPSGAAIVAAFIALAHEFDVTELPGPRTRLRHHAARGRPDGQQVPVPQLQRSRDRRARALLEAAARAARDRVDRIQPVRSSSSSCSVSTRSRARSAGAGQSCGAARATAVRRGKGG